MIDVGGVMGGRGNNKGRGSEHDYMLRRTAMQMLGQLPDDPQDARTIIEYMLVLLNTYMDPQTNDAPLGAASKNQPNLTIVADNPGG